VLAILCIQTLFAGLRRYTVAVLVLLAAALPTFLAEMYRPFDRHTDIRPQTTFTSFLGMYPEHAAIVVRQYFAPEPVWVLR
jgi:hypothetical protein